MRILFISGYDAWTQISQGLEPSHHLYGIHQFIERYEKRDDGTIYGILRDGLFENCSYGEVDFYKWESVKKDVLSHLRFLSKEGKKYDLIFDCLNRGSVWIGLLKRMGIIKSKVVTVMHHPSSYRITLSIAKSDAYVFFNETYKDIALNIKKSIAFKYHVNEWYPDVNWYSKIEKKPCFTDAFFIDNGKSERDRETMLEGCQSNKIAIDYAGSINDTTGYARSYKTGSISHEEIVARLKSYGCIVIPIKKFKNQIIGPLGITSFLDAIAVGCPVITSDNTCFSKDVSTYGLGMIYNPGDLDSFVDALAKLSGDKEFWRKCRDNMREYSVGKNIEKYSDKLLEIFNSVLKSHA